MKRVVLILFLLMCSSFADDLTHLAELEKGNAVVGEALKAKDLKGKVILFKYWAYNCPPCVEGLPALQALQDKYAESGKFIVILSHMVAYDKRLVEGNIKKTKIKATCYQGLELKKAPLTEDGIPLIVLIDHTGKVQAQNWELEGMEEKIDAAVKAAVKK